jgi:hypothetical protein
VCLTRIASRRWQNSGVAMMAGGYREVARETSQPLTMISMLTMQ